MDVASFIESYVSVDESVCLTLFLFCLSAYSIRLPVRLQASTSAHVCSLSSPWSFLQPRAGEYSGYNAVAIMLLKQLVGCHTATCGGHKNWRNEKIRSVGLALFLRATTYIHSILVTLSYLEQFWHRRLHGFVRFPAKSLDTLALLLNYVRPKNNEDHFFDG